MNNRQIWSRILRLIGSSAMLIGALDFMEGSFLILPGSGLVALGAWLGGADRRRIIYRAVVFGLIAAGMAAMVAAPLLSGPRWESVWWGWRVLPFLPYLLGWSLGLWGPDSPRWLLVLGIAAGLWCFFVLALLFRSSGQWERDLSPDLIALGVIIGSAGALTIGGCLWRESWQRGGHAQRTSHARPDPALFLASRL
jgi:hypothetical protein